MLHTQLQRPPRCCTHAGPHPRCDEAPICSSRCSHPHTRAAPAPAPPARPPPLWRAPQVGPLHLDHPTAFERGATDTFVVEGADVGQLLRLVVTCDGSGTRPLWHLDQVNVFRDPTHTDPDAAVHFPCR